MCDYCYRIVDQINEVFDDQQGSSGTISSNRIQLHGQGKEQKSVLLNIMSL